MIWRNWIRPYVYTVLLIGVVFQLWCLAWVGLYGVGLAPYTNLDDIDRLLTALQEIARSAARTR